MSSWYTGTPQEADDETIIKVFGDDPKKWRYTLYMSPWEKDVFLSATRHPREQPHTIGEDEPGEEPSPWPA